MLIKTQPGHPVPLPNLAPSVSRELSIPRVVQEYTQWCWAACCQMVLRHYGDLKTAQCDLANLATGRKDCCSNPSPSDCNQAIWTRHSIETDILDIYYHYGKTAVHHRGSIPFTTIRAEIDAGRPVEACFGGGRSHLIIVQGYEVDDSGRQNVFINDPDRAYSGGNRIPFLSLLSAYGSGGYWAETFTRLV
jgi:hypothetical protein